jgi:ATP-dependent RNA helicase DDX10/DBP4
MMPPHTAGRRHKPAGRPKANIKSLKRKRDVDDHEKLEKAVEELVNSITS